MPSGTQAPTGSTLTLTPSHFLGHDVFEIGANMSITLPPLADVLRMGGFVVLAKSQGLLSGIVITLVSAAGTQQLLDTTTGSLVGTKVLTGNVNLIFAGPTAFRTL